VPGDEGGVCGDKPDDDGHEDHDDRGAHGDTGDRLRPEPADKEEIDDLETALEHVSDHDRRRYRYEAPEEVAFGQVGHTVSLSL